VGFRFSSTDIISTFDKFTFIWTSMLDGSGFPQSHMMAILSQLGHIPVIARVGELIMASLTDDWQVLHRHCEQLPFPEPRGKRGCSACTSPSPNLGGRGRRGGEEGEGRRRGGVCPAHTSLSPNLGEKLPGAQDSTPQCETAWGVQERLGHH
jgi:hypothetical protein